VSTRRRTDTTLLVGLGLTALVVLAASIRFGAIDFSVADIWHGLLSLFPGQQDATLDQRIFLELRLPRAILCMLVGASLGVGGTLMQALFRNPIVEPGLVGTSSGAALGSALFFVLGGVFSFGTSFWALPVAACIGGVISTYAVFLLARSKEDGRASIVLLLLTGLAVNALCMSAIGFLSYLARDPQARSITFWSLGTMAGANWRAVYVVAFTTIAGTLIALRYGKQLNALMIGEEEATYLGVNVNRLKWIILSINVVIVAVATAFVGVISFVGLIVPHILRMLKGSDNRFLIAGSALMGAIILTLADLAARMVLRPAELPIGVVTSAVGVPIFLYLLRRRQYVF
jgi:iron complex transport system permease protein